MGKNSRRHIPKGQIPYYTLRETSAPIHNTNRTITCDNWFTTVPNIEILAQTPYNTPVTGTNKKNKREIPAEMKIASKEPPDSKFCFSQKVSLVSYTPKKNRIVLVASTFLRTNNIGEDKKPEIIRHYNKTKGGTDTFDKLCHAFSVTRRTNRWPVRVFFGMLDQAIVNARILLACKYMKNGKRTKELTAQYCLEKVYFHLVKDFLFERYKMPTLRHDIKLGIKGILGLDTEPTFGDAGLQILTPKQRCQLCLRCMDKKTRIGCSSCLRAMCSEHRSTLCTDCACQE